MLLKINHLREVGVYSRISCWIDHIKFIRSSSKIRNLTCMVGDPFFSECWLCWRKWQREDDNPLRWIVIWYTEEVGTNCYRRYFCQCVKGSPFYAGHLLQLIHHAQWKYVSYRLVNKLKSRFCFVLWHFKHCRLFNAKSMYIHINSSISKTSVSYKYTELFLTFKLFQAVYF